MTYVTSAKTGMSTFRSDICQKSEVLLMSYVGSPPQKWALVTYVIGTAVMPETYKFPALLEVRKFSIHICIYSGACMYDYKIPPTFNFTL